METKPPIYGVWIPGQGWLRNDKDIFADENKAKCEEVARMIGKRSRVLFIDDAIPAFEKLYLEQERRKWHIFKRS